MKIVALQTARAGSKSIPKKNLLEIAGHPLFAHSIIAASNSKMIDSVWCSTDDDAIKNLSNVYNFNVIDRPSYLSGDNDSHLEVIRHGVNSIESQIGKQDIVVLLLGNVIGLDSEALTEAIEMLEQYDSVVSVSKLNMFNPFRAMKVNAEGKLETYLPQEQISSTLQTNDKNSAGDIYFCNGNFWIMRRDVIFRENNKFPFQWLGNNIRPYIQNVFLELDADWQIDYVRASLDLTKGKIQ